MKRFTNIISEQNELVDDPSLLGNFAFIIPRFVLVFPTGLETGLGARVAYAQHVLISTILYPSFIVRPLHSSI